MNPLIYVAFFNIFAVPAVIYAHVQDVCRLLVTTFGEGGNALCPYTTNPILNIVYVNIIFFTLIFLMHVNSKIQPSPTIIKKPFHSKK